MFFDTHCHLDTPPFDADCDAVLARAHAAGVTRFLNPSYDLDSSRRAAALATARPDVWAAVGVHPNDIGHLDDQCLYEIEQLSQQPRVVAIGEIGLDYHWNTFPRQQQIDGFVRQLQLAQRLHLPVIIHCRDAYDDTLDVLAKFKIENLKLKIEDHVPPSFSIFNSQFSILLHSFAGNSQQAEEALGRGYYLGIGGPITYPKNESLREIVREMPLGQLLLETDAPYLSPQKFRGKRNEPSHIPLIAERIAQIRGISVAELGATTTQNAINFLGRGNRE